MKNFIFLFLAIIFETIATSALKASMQFTRIGPSIIVIIGYVLAFYFLSITLKTIPVGVAYALWSGIGIILITIAGVVLYKQIPDFPAVIGLVFIIAGVIIINVFSKTSVH